MANPILDALSGLLDVADMPGSYTRGLFAGRPGERLSGTELLNHYGFNPGEGVGGFLANMGTSILTDPLTYAIPGATALAGRLGRGATGLSAGKGLRMREGVTFAKGEGDATRYVGGLRNMQGQAARSRAGEVDSVLNAMPEVQGELGWYHPPSRTGRILPGPHQADTMRHELTHALINEATQGGSSAGLPLGWRMTANMQRSENPLINAIGRIGDEMAAHGADKSGAWRFLTNSRPEYVEQFARQSPLAAALYEGRYIPRAAAGAAGLAGAALAGLLGSQLGVGQ